MDTKLMLCRFPNNGFGENCDKFYFLDVLGTKYITYFEYNEVLEKMNTCVEINNKIFCGDDINDLVNNLSEYYNIKKW